MTQSSKKALQFVAFIGIDIIAFIVLYAICAFVLARIPVGGKLATNKEVAIYIKTNGVHTDLVVPIKTSVKNWATNFYFAHTGIKDSANYQYLAFGWGDKGFYLETPTWNDLTIRVALRAAFALSTTAIHTTFYKNMQENSSCKKINISKEQYLKLIPYIEQSLQLSKEGKPIYIPTTANYGITDAFYEAKGKYSLLQTCNTWANGGLKACEQKACLWTPFDTGIFLLYNN